MYARFTAGLPGYLKKRMTFEEALTIIRKRIDEREQNFLRIAKKGIYQYPRSPYLPLLQMAGCEYGDLEQSVKSKGLEKTLQQLKSEGVYVGFEEFKGRKQMVRGGKTFSFVPHDFDNPHLKNYYYLESGGSTGAGTRVATDLDKYVDRAPQRLITEYAHNMIGLPMAIWHSILPGTGFNSVISNTMIGNVPKKWFSPVARKDLQPSFKYRAATWYLLKVARMSGVPVPMPETVPIDEAATIARWVASTLRTHGKARLSTFVSLAVRVSLAAKEEGLDFTGAVLTGSGEPPTPAKVKHIKDTGAYWVPTYYVSEAGMVGFGCANPVDENDNHFMKDGLALIQSPSEVPHTDMNVDGYYLTSLLPSAPKIILNFESHDYGILEQRSCGCFLGECGFTDHVREIRSISKMTGEGMTLIGSDMLRILEEVLPARFGGSAQDYQFTEEENDRGITQVKLIVSPRIQLGDEQDIINTIHQAMPDGSPGADLGRAIWTQAKTIQVKRAEPVWTGRGKLMPLHLDRALSKKAKVHTQ